MHAVLVWFDRLPYGLLGCCGNTGAGTPGFNRLAAGSVTFDRCFAADLANPESGIADGIAQLSRHGIRVEVASEGTTRLVEQLRAQSDVDDAIEFTTYPTVNNEAVTQSIDVGQATDDRPQLTVFSLTGVPSDVTDWQSQQVAAAISRADDLAGRIVETLSRVESTDDLLLIVTAAAGLSSAVTGVVSPRDQLHEQAIHVPLFGRIGSAMEFGLRCGSIVSPADVATTLSAHLGRKTEACAGRDLNKELMGEAADGRDALVIQGHHRARGLMTDEWFLVTQLSNGAAADVCEKAAESASLFMKPDDLWDRLDVASQTRGVVESLVLRLIADDASGRMQA